MKVPREATKKIIRNIKYCTFFKCPKQAQGASRYKGAIGLCKRHGGGNPCKFIDGNGDKCNTGAYGATGLCTNHGGNPCQYIDGNGDKCITGAQGSTGFCSAHGGGRRCQGFDNNGDKCGKSAQGSTGFCKAHGGGPRCNGFEKDGTKCCKGARDATGFCTNHGGNHCQYIDGNGDKCITGAQGSTGFCKAHGGGRRCQGFDDNGDKCCKSAQGSTGFCKAHGGGKRCPNCVDWTDSRSGQKKFDGYCATCYHRLNPNTTRPVFRNYKTKEFAVLRHLERDFPNHHIVNDRRVSDGCSKKKPDFFFELLTHVIMVEVDENGHMSYDQSCENKRMMELSQDIAHRPLVFIRFNPDKTSTGPGCWGYDETGRAVVKKKRAIEWQKRLAALTAKIELWLTKIPEKTVELIKLYY